MVKWHFADSWLAQATLTLSLTELPIPMFRPESRGLPHWSLHVLITQLSVAQVDFCDALAAARFHLGMVDCKPRAGRRARL